MKNQIFVDQEKSEVYHKTFQKESGFAKQEWAVADLAETIGGSGKYELNIII